MAEFGEMVVSDPKHVRRMQVGRGPDNYAVRCTLEDGSEVDLIVPHMVFEAVVRQISAKYLK